jgi:hypothetical protein
MVGRGIKDRGIHTAPLFLGLKYVSKLMQYGYCFFLGKFFKTLLGTLFHF